MPLKTGGMLCGKPEIRERPDWRRPGTDGPTSGGAEPTNPAGDFRPHINISGRKSCVTCRHLTFLVFTNFCNNLIGAVFLAFVSFRAMHISGAQFIGL